MGCSLVVVVLHVLFACCQVPAMQDGQWQLTAALLGVHLLKKPPVKTLLWSN